MAPSHDPALVLASMAAMLGLATWRDLRARRIDNWITASGAAIAVGLHLALHGAAGAVLSLAGLLTGLIVLLPFYALGGMAAGDVKLMAAAGAFLGPANAVWAAGFSLLAGAVMALAVMAAAGGLLAGTAHMARQAYGYAFTRIWIAAPPGSAAARRFPYAAAIAGGCLVTAAAQVAGVLPGHF